MTRDVTNQILEMVEEGLLDRDTVIMACLKWMSEDDVAEMARHNELIEEDEYEYENDGQPDEAQEWYDFDPDC